MRGRVFFGQHILLQRKVYHACCLLRFAPRRSFRRYIPRYFPEYVLPRVTSVIRSAAAQSRATPSFRWHLHNRVTSITLRAPVVSRDAESHGDPCYAPCRITCSRNLRGQRARKYVSRRARAPRNISEMDFFTQTVIKSENCESLSLSLPRAT